MTIKPLTTIRTMVDLKYTSEVLGEYFFSKGAIQFFKSRILPHLYVTGATSGYFVTSEQSDNDPREYNIRSYAVIADRRESDNREFDRISILTVGDSHKTRAQAQAYALKLKLDFLAL